jgi:hypothetical protein
MKIDEMLQMPEKNVEDFFKKNLKKDMTTSELLFAVCTKLKWKPAGEGYSYTDKMMRFSFSESGSDIKYPQLDTYFECKKNGRGQRWRLRESEKIEKCNIVDFPNYKKEHCRKINKTNSHKENGRQTPPVYF